MAFAAPAIPPARAISFSERLGNGDIRRFETPYEAKRRELTPAIPISGLNMPGFNRKMLSAGGVNQKGKIDTFV